MDLLLSVLLLLLVVFVAANALGKLPAWPAFLVIVLILAYGFGIKLPK